MTTRLIWNATTAYVQRKTWLGWFTIARQKTIGYSDKAIIRLLKKKLK